MEHFRRKEKTVDSASSLVETMEGKALGCETAFEMPVGVLTRLVLSHLAMKFHLLIQCATCVFSVKQAKLYLCHRCQHRYKFKLEAQNEFGEALGVGGHRIEISLSSGVVFRPPVQSYCTHRSLLTRLITSSLRGKQVRFLQRC